MPAPKFSLLITGQAPYQLSTSDRLAAAVDAVAASLHKDCADNIRDSGVIRLANVAGTNALTAIVAPELTAADVVIGSSSVVRIVPALPNTGAVTLSVGGGAALPWRSADGGDLAAGALNPARAYLLRRVGNVWRTMVGDIALSDLTAERGNRITGTGLTGTMILEGVSGSGNAIAGAMPALVAALGVGPGNLRHVTLIAPLTNTGPATINIDGTGDQLIRDADGVALTGGEIVSGRILVLEKFGNVWRMANSGLSRSQIGTLVDAGVAGEAGLRQAADATLDGRLQVIAAAARAATPGDADWLAAQDGMAAWQAAWEITPDHATVDGSGNVTAVTAGGRFGGAFTVQDTGAPPIKRDAGGLTFANGQWLRRLVSPALPVGKLLLVMDITPKAGAASSSVWSAAGFNLDADGARFVAGVTGMNLAFETRPDYAGRRQQVAALYDTDADVVRIWQRDGYSVEQPYVLAAGSLGDIRIGRFGSYTLHRLRAYHAAPGAELALGGFEAWARLARQPIWPAPRRAQIAGGFGQSIYQGASVPVAAQAGLEEGARLQLKRVTGLVTEAGVAVGAIGAGNNPINQTVAATGLTGMPGSSETILFAAARHATVRRRDLGLEAPMIIAGTNGYGGQGIEEFDDDPATGTGSTVLWRNERYWLEQARARAIAAGYTPGYDYLMMIHGTADKAAARGWYLERAKRAIDLRVAHALSLFGSAPKLILGQSGGDADTSNDGPSGWSVVLDQLDLLRHYSGLLIGPEYALMIEDQNVHTSYLERNFFGELAAEAQVSQERGRSWNLLWPELRPGMVSGNQVILPVDLPWGSNTLMVPEPNKYQAYGGAATCANFGFEAPGRTITGVAFSGRICTVTLDAAPTRLRYAMQVQNVASATDAQGLSYTAHRGLIATDWAMASRAQPGRTQRRWMPSMEWVFA